MWRKTPHVKTPQFECDSKVLIWFSEESVERRGGSVVVLVMKDTCAFASRFYDFLEAMLL